jgi:hypothetical protein
VEYFPAVAFGRELLVGDGLFVMTSDPVFGERNMIGKLLLLLECVRCLDGIGVQSNGPFSVDPVMS